MPTVLHKGREKEIARSPWLEGFVENVRFKPGMKEWSEGVMDGKTGRRREIVDLVR